MHRDIPDTAGCQKGKVEELASIVKDWPGFLM